MDRTPHEEYRAKNSLEKEVSSHFKEELDAILSLHITPETITTFYDEALSKTILLIAKTVQRYKEEGLGAHLSGKALEDAATTHYSIPSVTNVLTRIEERDRYIQELKDTLITKTGYSSEVFVPPTADERFIVTGSGNGFEEKKLIPRLFTLSYILEHDIGISMQDVDIVQGTTIDNMMRKHPYVRLSIPLESGDRIVYICEEEGNATFIFDRIKILEKIGDIRLLDVTDKVRYKEHIHDDPSVGTIIRQSPAWREDVTEALTESFESKAKEQKIKPAKAPPSDFEKLVPKKKEGWKSVGSLTEKCKSAGITIKKFAEQFRDEHPEWFEEQKINGREWEHYHPDLVTKIIEYFSKIPRKMDRWESARSLWKARRIDLRSIKKFVEQFRDEYPEWFKEQQNRSMKVEHYHPDLVKKIVEHFDSIQKKKDGWEGSMFLYRKKRVASYSSIKKFAEQFRDEHPEWFEEQKKKSGPKSEHYHPDLVKKIVEHFDSIPKKKDGWESMSSIRTKCGAGSFTVVNYVEQFRDEHPEWFEEQKVNGQESEHYHPDLVTKIIEYFSKIPRKMDGWESARSFMGKYKVADITIKKFAEQFRDEHPEWFEERRPNGRGRSAEHYHPDLVAKIVERFGRKETGEDKNEKEN